MLVNAVGFGAVVVIVVILVFIVSFNENAKVATKDLKTKLFHRLEMSSRGKSSNNFEFKSATILFSKKQKAEVELEVETLNVQQINEILKLYIRIFIFQCRKSRKHRSVQ